METDFLAKFLIFNLFLSQIKTSDCIIGGEDAERYQFPFIVCIKFENKAEYFSGALISAEYAITAAYYATRVDIFLILGAYNIGDNDEPEREFVNIHGAKENIIIHEGYQKEKLNDIALFKLTKKVNLSDKVKPIALPTYHDAKYLNLDDQVGVIVGWGSKNEEPLVNSPILQFAEVNFISNKICKHFFRTTFDVGHICTDTAYGKGICLDNGAPLIHRRDNGEYVLIGLGSAAGLGKGCAQGWPSVYTKITHFLGWIKEHSNIEIDCGV